MEGTRQISSPKPLGIIVVNRYHRLMTMKETETSDTEMAATLFRSLADPNRLAIVKHLMLSEHRVADLVGHLGLAQSTVSAHVRGLRDSGLLTARVRGRATFYSLAEPELTTNLLAVADDLLVATGEVPVICEPEVEAP